MPTSPSSSKRRYTEYLAHRRENPAPPLARTEKGQTRSRPIRELIARFWELLAGHRVATVVATSILVLSTTTALLTPASTKIVIDYVLTNHPGPSGLPAWLGLGTDRLRLLFLVAAGLIAVAVTETGLGLLAHWHLNRVRKRMQVVMRRRVFEHAAHLPLHRVQALKSGGVASLLRRDANGAAELIFNGIFAPTRAAVRLVGTLIILTLVDWTFLLGAALLLPVVVLSHRTWIARIRPMWRDVRKTAQEVDAHASEAFGGIRVVRTFAREKSEARRFVTGNGLMIRQEMRSWWWQRGVWVAWSLLIPAASTIVLVYGGSRVIDGSLTIGDLMMFATYVAMLLSPIEALVWSATSIQNNLAAFDRVLDVLEEEREDAGRAPGVVLAPDDVKGAFTLDDVHFTYPEAKEEVLRGVSADIAPGQTVALVGRSGAGKTTLTHLIARFYAPTSGRILLDGADLAHVELASFRRLLGVVEQDVFLFDGTIADNIAYARPDASPDDIVRAARLAHADEFIRTFEDGYDSVVGERGVRLSGGQRQRIAIARAALKDPRVLILDEATSHLDAESEQFVREGLGALLDGRTAFVIAHRLSTVRDADLILVLDDGRVVESGTHDTLVQKGGRYVSLLAAQLGPDEAAALARAAG